VTIVLIVAIALTILVTEIAVASSSGANHR